MALKNKKAAGLLLALSAVLLSGGVLLFRWWSSGAVPPAPDNFFDAAQTARTLERLRASRLDQQPLVELVEAVRQHIEEAEAVSFSNPTEALADVVRLERDLTRMDISFARLLEQTAEAGAADWQQRFQTFEQQAADAYRDARDWCRVFATEDLDRLGFPALLDRVVTGKDRSASLPAFPPWQRQQRFFREHYTAFDQAYRLRNEQDIATLRTHLLATQSAPLRWYLARLYEARLPTPGRFCTDTLRQEAEQMSALSEELAAADPLQDLAAWGFPHARRDNLLSLTEITQPLEETDSLAEWVETWSLLAPQRERLERETLPTGAAPDPALRAVFLELSSLVRATSLAYARVRQAEAPEAWRGFVEYVRAALPEPEVRHCLLEPLHRVTRAWQELQEAERHLLSVRAADAPPTFSRAFTEARLAAESFSNILGIEIAERLLATLVDQWGAQRWPGWEDAADYAERLRELVVLGLWPDPRLAALAAYLELVAQAESSGEVRDQMEQWSAHIRPSIADYPLLQRRIEAALPVHRDQWVLTEMQSLIETRREADLRQYLEALGTGETPEDLRALSEAALAMLRLPERVGALQLDNLPRFAERNADLLPAPPPPDSVLYPLYAQQVLPLIELAEQIVRLPTTASPEFPVALEQAIAARHRLADVYPQWHGFDEPLAQALLGSASALMVMEPQLLLESARSVARLLAWEGLSEETRDTMLELQRLLAACVLFLGEDPCAPGFGDWVEQARALQIRFDLANTALPDLLDLASAAADFCRDWQEAPHSFRLLRERYREALATLRPMLEAQRFPADGIRARLQEAGAAIEQLRGLVEKDMEVARREETQPADLLRVAAAYRAFADEPEQIPRLATYALAQAASLEAAAEPQTLSLTAALSDGARLRIELSLLDPPPATFGYGERWPRRGEMASLWMETGGQRATLLQGTWRERDGQLRIDPEEPVSTALPLAWGQPIELGVTVVHSQSGERALLPDEERSRWNPLNYGLFQVEPHDYKLASFPSLHAMLRELRAAAEDADYAIQLDPVLRRRIADETPQWMVVIGEHPPGRDLDWPTFFAPLSTEETEAIGRELREAIDLWIEEGENPLLDLLP